MADKVIDTSASGTSPDALLKQAVADGKEKAALSVVPAVASKRAVFVEPRLTGVAGAALALGLLLGAGAATITTADGDRSSDALGQIRSHLDTGRADVARLQGEIERIGKSLAQFQETTEAARGEAKARGATLTDRIAKSEQAIGAKLAAMAEHQEQTERDQTVKIAALSTQLDKRVAAHAPVVAPQAKAPTSEPTETGAIADVKPKPAAVDSWAVREVYDGIAMVEDRKRRLVEVGPGDTIPGIGRVEAIERRGRTWVVVTKQGLITPQTW